MAQDAMGFKPIRTDMAERREQIDADLSNQLEIIGEEVRHHRKQRGLSLDALASVSGVSRSMISKVERAEAVPSTTILSRLAEALGVTFSRLMAPASDREIMLIPAARQPVLRDETTGFARRCLSPVLPGRGIDWVLNTLPPGGTTGEFVGHRRGVAEYIYVLKGRLNATIGDRALVVGEGDSLYFEADAGHAFTNIGTGACEYFLVIDASRPALTSPFWHATCVSHYGLIPLCRKVWREPWRLSRDWLARV